MALRFEVEGQREDARLYLDVDGVMVLAVKPGLVSARAAVVLSRALALIPEHRYQNPERITKPLLRQVVNDEMDL